MQAVLAASVGEERRAETKIKLAVERGKGFGHFHHTAYHIALACALMNKGEQAIKWLEAAAWTGSPATRYSSARCPPHQFHGEAEATVGGLQDPILIECVPVFSCLLIYLAGLSIPLFFAS